jgi:hypothetical protein
MWTADQLKTLSREIAGDRFISRDSSREAITQFSTITTMTTSGPSTPRRECEDNIKMGLQEVGWGAWTGLRWFMIGTGGGLL